MRSCPRLQDGTVSSCASNLLDQHALTMVSLKAALFFLPTLLSGLVSAAPAAEPGRELPAHAAAVRAYNPTHLKIEH